MNQIELYDILTLSDNKDYTILRILDYNNHTYYLLSEIDATENLNLNNLKIVEQTKDQTLTEPTDPKLIAELTELFASALEVDL